MANHVRRSPTREKRVTPPALEQDELQHSKRHNNVTEPADVLMSSENSLSPQNILHLQRTIGNQAVMDLVTSRQATHEGNQYNLNQINDHVLQRDPNVIDVDIIEIEQHPGDITDIVTDTLRTARGCLMNFGTALENFETRITNDSGEEAAPKDPAMIAMKEVGTFVLGQLRGQIAGAVPGGKIANDLIGLGEKIGKAIEAEKKRSRNATDKNAAANFIIDMRSLINDAAVDIETNMTEDIVSVRNKYDNAETDGERKAIRNYQELINSNITSMEKSTFSSNALFTNIVEYWINETNSSTGKPARVFINLDADWNVREAYLDAPFGSRLAEQLEKQGPLNVMELSVPRVIQWFPHYGKEGGGLVRCLADMDAEGAQAKNVRAMGFQSQGYLQQFINLLSTQPIPETTTVNGNKVG